MNSENKGKNIVYVQKLNRSLVIRTIQKKHQTTRTEISEKTGLNKATVTNIVNDLINWGIVREVGFAAGKYGRRSIALELATDSFDIIGIWLTRRHLHIGLYDIYGECRFKECASIGLNSPVEELIDQMSFQIERLKNNISRKKVLGVALALPGPYIKNAGKIALLTERHDWQNVDIVQRLRERIDLDIIAEHDANAAVTAEWCYTENYDEKASLLCIMAGQGVGAGIVEDGRIFHGCLGVAGEIGHMSVDCNGVKCECGNYGCLEKYSSSLAVMKKVKNRISGGEHTVCTENSSFRDIVYAYKNGDALVKEVIDEAARYLGYGIANIVNLFNPAKIIIGDEMSLAGERFLDVIKATVKERVIPDMYNNMEIKLSTLSDSVLRGVCMTLMEEIVRRPEDFFNRQDNGNLIS